MTTLQEGGSGDFTIPRGRTLQVRTTGEAVAKVGFREFTVLPGQNFEFYTDRDLRRVTVTAVIGAANYTVFYSDVVPFTGDRTLALTDDGKVLRCDDASNVTVTAPNNLPECFSVGFAMWGAGTITVAAGSGATNRSSTSAISTQYQWGSLVVAKNTDDASAEFVLGGDFT